MPGLNIEFTWSGGHRFECSEKLIRQAGKGSTLRRPLEAHPTLYLEFAHLDGSAEACVSFAEHWGLLAVPAKPGAQESLGWWQDQISAMRNAEALLPRDGIAIPLEGRLTRLDVMIRPGKPDGRPALYLLPPTLLAAMWLQLGQALIGGKTIRLCRQCGHSFETGAGAKRTIAVFCSHSCRDRFNNALRAKKSGAA